MRTLLLASLPLLLLSAPVVRGDGPADASKMVDDSYRKAFHALKPEEIEAKRIDALPATPFRQIDVSERVRSASFGHKTTLLVPTTEGQTKQGFYVEYGRSTNRPAQHFGPFPPP